MNKSPRPLAWFLAFLTATAFSANSFVGQTTELIGQPLLTQSAQKKVAAVGDAISVGARLQTATTDNIQLRFDDGTLVFLASSSDLTVREYNFEATRKSGFTGDLFLADGQVRIITGVGPKSAPGKFSVSTPSGTLYAYGTDFTVTVCGAHSVAIRKCTASSVLRVNDGKVVAQTNKTSTPVEFGAGGIALLSASGVQELKQLPEIARDRTPEPGFGTDFSPDQSGEAGNKRNEVPRTEPPQPASPS